MSYFLDRMREAISDIVKKHFLLSEVNIKLDAVPENAEGDFALNCFILAKDLDKTASELAIALKEIVLSELGYMITHAHNVGPYLNISLSSSYIHQQLSSDFKLNPIYGFKDTFKGQTAIVDMVGLNLAKPFSVGHLRPTVQGQVVSGMLRSQGYTVVRDNHLGDWGTSFGMWMVAYELYGSEDKVNQDNVYELSRLYKIFRDMVKKEQEDGGVSPSLEAAKKWFLKLQNKDEEAIRYWRWFTDISIEHCNKVLKLLRVEVDEQLGESFYADQMPIVVEDLIRKGIAKREHSGAVIVDLSHHKFDTPMLIQKSDGGYLYTTSDIATILYRQNRWQPSLIVYCVDYQQEFHFKQLFALAKDLGISTNLIHSMHGAIEILNEDKKREKMSSRKGVVLLEDLISTTTSKALEIVKDRDIDDRKKNKIATSIAIGAIKFSDIMNNKRSNMLFSADDSLRLHGYSSPYLQYSLVRIKSILRKSKISNNLTVNNLKENDSYDYNSEKALLLHLSKFPDILSFAASLLEAHHIAKYLFELATTFSSYYENTTVLDSNSELSSARLRVVLMLEYVMEKGLDLLGIDILEEM
jgi:arginyl-tRNA synthetase